MNSKFLKSVKQQIELKEADIERFNEEIEAAKALKKIAENQDMEAHYQKRVERFDSQKKQAKDRIKTLEKSIK